MTSRWEPVNADSYDRKWKAMAARGEDPHGEVAFVQRFSPATVLDAGCGTGRVAIELARRGIVVVGADLDAAMIAGATAKAPDLVWHQVDLAALDLRTDDGQRTQFDVVVMAGNVMLFVAPGTEAAVVDRLAEHVAPGGWLIAGFQLGRSVIADEYEGWLTDAGLDVHSRYASWQGDPFVAPGGYLVSVAARPVSSSG